MDYITSKKKVEQAVDVEENNNKSEDQSKRKRKISGNSTIIGNPGDFVGSSKVLAEFAEEQIFKRMAKRLNEGTSSDNTIASLNDRLFTPKDFYGQGEYTRKNLQKKITDLESKKTLFLKTTKLHRSGNIPLDQYNNCDRLRYSLWGVTDEIKLLAEEKEKYLEHIETINSNTLDENIPLYGSMHNIAKEISQYCEKIDNLSLKLENVHEDYANEFNRNRLHEYLADETTDLYHFYDVAATSHWRAKAKVHFGRGENDNLSDQELESYENLLRKKSKTMLEGTHICSRTTIEGIKGIIESNRVKNMFETKTSRGRIDQESRTDAENALFGYDLESPDILRPKYGFLSRDPYKKASNSYLDRYGPFTMIYDKEEIKEQTTVTFADSLALGNSRTHNHLSVRPALFTKPHEGIFPLTRVHNDTRLREPDEPLSKYKSIDNLYSYAEAQIHKIVRPKHIKEVTSSYDLLEQEIKITANNYYKTKFNDIIEKSREEVNMDEKCYNDIKGTILKDTNEVGFSIALERQILKDTDSYLKEQLQALLNELQENLPKLVSEMKKQAEEHLSKKGINLRMLTE